MPQYNIDAGLKQPAYMQLYHQIRDDITRGVCPYGMRLPSKRFLAAETGTSVITVQLYPLTGAQWILCQLQRK